MPTVSVVVPLYQTERYIAETLRSVLAQTFTDFEVLVIDDGSRDNGPAIARGFADPRITVITQVNRGLAGARNSGIRNARGAFVALLDADDLWHPDKLARHVAHFAGNPALGVSFSHSRLIDETSAPLGLVQQPSGRPLTVEEHFCNNPIGNGSAPVFRRKTLDDIAFHDTSRNRTCWFDEDFRQSEDVECWVRIAATTNWVFGCVAEPLTDYRVNTNGLSANVERQLETWMKLRAKLKSYAPDIEAKAGPRAEGYMYRFFARRSIANGDATAAARYIAHALNCFPRMLIEEPLRTSVTAAAAATGLVLPRRLFERLQQSLLAIAARHPTLRA